MLTTKKAKIDHNPQLKKLQASEERAIKEVLFTEDPDYIKDYFNTPEMLERINNYRFRDGEPIFIYTCGTQWKAAKVLFELHDIDLTLKSHDGYSVLGVLILRPRIINSFFDLIFERMQQKRMFVSEYDLKLAESYLIQRHSNQINQEVSKLYANMQAHNKKLAATQNTTSTSEPIVTQLPVSPSTTEITSTTSETSAASEIPTTSGTITASEIPTAPETIAASETPTTLACHASTLKTRLDKMLLMFEEFKNNRDVFKQSRERAMNSADALFAEREKLITYLEQNKLDIFDLTETCGQLVPGLNDTFNKFVIEQAVFKTVKPEVQQSAPRFYAPTPKYGPFTPQYTQTISPRSGSNNSDYSSAGPLTLSAEEVAEAFNTDSPRQGLVDSPSFI